MPLRLIGTVGGEVLAIEAGDGGLEVELTRLAGAHEGGLEEYFA